MSHDICSNKIEKTHCQFKISTPEQLIQMKCLLANLAQNIFGLEKTKDFQIKVSTPLDGTIWGWKGGGEYFSRTTRPKLIKPSIKIPSVKRIQVCSNYPSL